MSTRRSSHSRVFLGLALVATAIRPGLPASADRISWRSGPIETASKSPRETRDAIAALAARGESRHLVVQFDGPLGPKKRAELESSGLRLLRYLGNNAFFVALSKPHLDAAAVTRTSSIVHVGPVERTWKLHPTFAVGEVPPWAIVSAVDGDAPVGPTVVGAYVLFHSDVPLVPDGVNLAIQHGAVVRSEIHSVNGLVVELPIAQIPALADEDAVQWIEPPLPPMEVVNDSVRENTQADIVQAPPYGLDGTGVNVLVYDGLPARASHLDFGGRLFVRDDDGDSHHATHVSCTIGGSGAVSGGLYRGMAPNVTLQSYGFEYDGSGIFLYNNPGDIESDYDEAINVYGAHIANNSIGTNTCNNGFDCEITGDYGVTAQLIDAIVHGSLGAPFRVVWANGNERSCGRCGDEGVHTLEGFHSTAPPACAKNSITVGALNSNDDSVTYFTSWGPTDDGRLKPDVSAPGCQEGSDGGVTSCSSNGDYLTYCGTSMAAPTVTGLAALLLQDFRVQFPGRPDPLNSTLKALLAHNATDLEEPGPDYKTGYGAVRIQDTIDFMRAGSFLEGQIDQGGEFMTFTYTLTQSEPVKITLAWDDVPGTPNVETALVNDLDLVVFDQALNRYYPWTLDPDNPAAPATQSRPDRINNIEQVYVDSAAAGVWTIRVVAFNVPGGPQHFSLCIEPQFLEDCNGNGLPDVDEIQTDPSLDCTGNGALDECEPDCDGDGTADSCAMAVGASTDCNFDFLPDDCEPWSDCNGNGVFDSCDITEGGLSDCNANWIPDLCMHLEDDCNSNLVPDSCDITAGTSTDCDGNGLPDDCQDTSTDCNDNGTWDACDIAIGASEDYNTNGIPDECEPNRTIYVDITTCPETGKGTPVDPYCKIRDAVDTSISGDIVQVADGIYAGDGQTSLRFGGRTITVRSENGPDNCIIDGQWIYGHRGFIFLDGETEDAVVDGFRIYKAYGDRGSGIFIDGASPTIRNCQFEQCATAASNAAVIQARNNSEPTLVNCDISASYGSNAVSNAPGSRMTMIDCSLHHQGSGVHNTGEMTAVNCSFRNHCHAIFSSGNITLTNCSFSENLHAFEVSGCATATLTGCTFIANHEAVDGCGCGSLVLKGCTVAQAPRRSFVAPCFIPVPVDEPFDEVDVSGTTLIENSILRSGIITNDGMTLTVSYSNIRKIANAGCDDCTIQLNEGVIDVDPRFVFDDQGDPRLAPDSPCIDAGDPGFYPLFRQTDIDGDPRILNGTVDMGADEAVEILDCNNNQRPDWQDIAEGISADVNANGISDECEARWARHVDDDAPSDPGPGDPTVSDPLEDGTRAHPFDTIQEAIDAAWDVVLVMDGIYTGEGNRDLSLRGRKLVVRSVNGPLNCIIDAGGDARGFVFLNGESPDSGIEGLTIINGKPSRWVAEQSNHVTKGGAILIRDSSPRIENCILAANRAPWGGAIDLENGSPTITGCRFVGNHDNYGGGAIYIRSGSSPLISKCAFAGNYTGTIRCVNCSATIQDSVIVGNRASELAGGISCYGVDAFPTIRRCTVANNHVLPDRDGAGGLYVEAGADLSVVNTLLWGNTGSPHGSVTVGFATTYFAYCDVEGGDPGEGALWGAGNINQDPLFPPRSLGVWTADGVYDLQTHRVTLADSAATWQENELVGLFINPDTSQKWEFLIVANTATEIQILPEWGTLDDGMSWVLAGAAYEVRDYHLSLASPCINAGDPGYVPGSGATDIDNEPRVEGGRVDMGSDEVHDCNQNSTPDYQDIARSTSEDCDGNDIPDECEAWLDCNTNGILDACDIREEAGRDCNENTVPDECDLADATSLDRNLNTVPDECDIADGVALDCNLNGIIDASEIAEGTSDDINSNEIPDECDPDCQPNGIPDDWDFALGTSEDCNGNGSPDECEWFDCNQNGTLDGCDLSDGSSEDCNGNLLPDECEVDEYDCNENAVPDNCDIGLGTSSDCQPNEIPDDCETDCNANGLPDECETLPDTDGDSVVDCYDLCPCTPPDICICPPLGECCWFDGTFCLPDYPPDLCLEHGGTPECTEAFCQDGCLMEFVDCNGNGIPDIRDISCYDYCDPPCGQSADCNLSGIPDECDIADGTSDDVNGDGVPDECARAPTPQPGGPACLASSDCTGAYDRADCVAGLCYAPKNRYLSIDPTNSGPVAYQIELAASPDYPLAIGRTWWIDEPACYDYPNGNPVLPSPPTCEGVDRFGWVSMLTSAPATREWTEVPLHITECGIVPDVVYEIRASVDGGASFSDALTINTAHDPDGPSQSWGDITGGPVPGMPGLWLPPERATNLADVQNAIRTFENRSEDTGFPPRVWVDVEINQVINLGDVQFIVNAFEGTAYADIALPLIGIHPADCP